MATILIAISGLAGSGKDTFAKILVDELKQNNITSKIYKFALPLKKCIEAITGIDIKSQERIEVKSKFMNEWGMTVREMTQRLGTDAIRNNFHPDTWLFASGFKKDNSGAFTFFPKNGESVSIFTDLRFENEYKAIKDSGGIVIHLSNDSYYITKNNEYTSHISEHGLASSYENEPPTHIFNNDSYEKMLVFAKKIVNGL